MMSIVLEPVQQPKLEKFDLKKEKKELQELLKSFNDIISEIPSDFTVHIACVKTQQDVINQILVHNNAITFS